MSEKFIRKPLGNFFIKKDLQIGLIKKIVMAVMISTLVCLFTLFIIYLLKYKSDSFYRVTLDMNATISDRESIVWIILPSLLISGIVNIFIAISIGLYASRKYAVPIFKLEQWIYLLREGHLNSKLRFREKEEMKELCDSCNKFTEELNLKFGQIQQGLLNLKKNALNQKELDKIEEVLKTIEIDSDTIEIHTSYLRTRDHRDNL